MIRFLLLLLSLAAPVAAEAGRAQDALRIELLPGWRQADGSHVAALRFRLAPGWKTYWRSAGSAGISPRMDWRRSRGAVSVAPHWPVPQVFDGVGGGGQSIGYASDFILPLIVRPEVPGAPVRLDGKLDLGVCAQTCLPVRTRVSGVLSPGGAPDPAILAALADRPTASRAEATCRLSPTEDGLALTGEIALAPVGRAEAVVFELPDPDLWVTDAAVLRQGDRLAATSEVIAKRGRPVSVDRSRVRITVIGQGRAVEIAGCGG